MKTKIRNMILLALSVYIFIFSQSLLIAQQPYSVPTTIATPFYVAYGRVDTGLNIVQKTITLTGTTADTTKALTVNDSGSLVLFTRTAGNTVTLPAITVVGMFIDFATTSIATGGTFNTIITSAATEFLEGGPLYIDTDGQAGGLDAITSFRCNGTSQRALRMDGGVTGGQPGTKFRATAISTTKWSLEGRNVGAGSVVTACATN